MEHLHSCFGSTCDRRVSVSKKGMRHGWRSINRTVDVADQREIRLLHMAPDKCMSWAESIFHFDVGHVCARDRALGLVSFLCAQSPDLIIALQT